MVHSQNIQCAETYLDDGVVHHCSSTQSYCHQQYSSQERLIKSLSTLLIAAMHRTICQNSPLWRHVLNAVIPSNSGVAIDTDWSLVIRYLWIPICVSSDTIHLLTLTWGWSFLRANTYQDSKGPCTETAANTNCGNETLIVTVPKMTMNITLKGPGVFELYCNYANKMHDPI